MDDLWYEYLEFLIWRCNLRKYTKYRQLFEVLHNMEYTWVLDRDENRAEDGRDLRDEYEGFDDLILDEVYKRPCSVLEMMLALSIAADDNIIGDPSEEHPEVFFLEMLKNLGLTEIHMRRDSENEIKRVIRRWLDRKFEKNGVGSPFPVYTDQRDQRKMEIWDQVNNYIFENYD